MAVLLNLLVWLLLIVCVALLVVMFVWWGGLTAASVALDRGVSAAEVRLSGAALSASGQLSSLVAGALSTSDASLAALFSGAGLRFTPVCAPMCLNLGSLGPVLRLADSCVCGAGVVAAARDTSRRGATAAAVGLAGAAAIWLAACWLLVIGAGHAVTAGFDRRSAAWLREQRSAAHVLGFAARAKDCVPLSEDDGAGGAGGARPALPGAGGIGGVPAGRRLSHDQRPQSSGV
jgi:hypothetical protein